MKTSRRGFLKLLGAALPALVIPGLLCAKEPAKLTGPFGNSELGRIESFRFIESPIPEDLKPSKDRFGHTGFVPWNHYYKSAKLNQNWIERLDTVKPRKMKWKDRAFYEYRQIFRRKS
jgi:hypothetical protein